MSFISHPKSGLARTLSPLLLRPQRAATPNSSMWTTKARFLRAPALSSWCFVGTLPLGCSAALPFGSGCCVQLHVRPKGMSVSLMVLSRNEPV
jgi:hypothetical protein